MAVNQSKNKIIGVSVPLAVMAAWVFAFGFLIYNNRYYLFLKPQFGILIYISLFICSLFALSFLFSGTNHHVQDSMIKGMITLLPIMFILAAGDNTLGSYALSKRTMAAPQKAIQMSAPEAIKEKTSDPLDMTISRLTQQWDTYKGSKVSVEGLFYEPVGKNKDMAIVFRYLITCCAADAQPIGLVIKKNNIQQIKNNDWVRITGVVHEETIDGSLVIFMELEHIEKTIMPSKNAAYFYN
ncbi:MAG: TIGR03943 family protein [Proteobacteria bacterium]|nr:TIGR03943 family protein [Pseudomonadota bacterium]MBU1583155.1 TIGR03943 family protein [Pseudomonadota bacterium]MBU2452932.1 TIGR03943 family protein [Pseudomonadota bacterium]MBU2627522.1 TIGR03943 family protein [Pseudomonadota bacterium]